MNNDSCDQCSDLKERALLAEAAVEARQAEIRVEIEDRMAAGFDVTTMLDALSEAGVDVADLLTPS